jgi:hypothetical protein
MCCAALFGSQVAVFVPDTATLWPFPGRSKRLPCLLPSFLRRSRLSSRRLEDLDLIGRRGRAALMGHAMAALGVGWVAVVCAVVCASQHPGGVRRPQGQGRTRRVRRAIPVSPVSGGA